MWVGVSSFAGRASTFAEEPMKRHSSKPINTTSRINVSASTLMKGVYSKRGSRVRRKQMKWILKMFL